MACYAGKDGVVTLNANNVGELTSFSIEQTAETIECTAMGDTFREYTASFRNWTGSMDFHWDPDDVGQNEIVTGATVTVVFYPEGSDTGDYTLTGNAIITALSTSGSFDGLFESSATLQGTGELVANTVPA